MHQASHDLIRQVQICTRSAAGLSDYNPSDPTLPVLPPLSAAIAASASSPPQLLRCKNCKGGLLRGSDSIICVYCGLPPKFDVVPDPITFTSTVASRWLLRSLRLDGSEMVDPNHKSEQNQGYNSPKSLIPLSEFLNFKISWPAETEKQQETVFQEKNSEQSEGSSRLTGVPPDKFFLNSKRNIVSDVSAEQPFAHNHIGTSDDGKNVAAFGHRNLFQDVKSSEAFSGWEADFQSADSEKQPEVRDVSVDSKNNVKDPKSFDLSTGLGVNLASHIDSVFGPKDPNDGKREENRAVSPAFDDWNSDDVWNNLSSSTSHFSGGVDPPVKITNELEIDHSFDLFQDFQSQTNNADKTEDNKITSDEHKIMDENLFGEWNDFTGGVDYQASTAGPKSSEMDIFSFDDRSAKSNFGSFSQPNLFSTSTSNNNTLTEVKALTSETPTSDWLFDSSSPSHESGQVTNGKSAEDDVKMLISQMHDLSFMLDSNLSIPSGPDAAPNS
ncbi:dentin sialophospho protein [Striga asiatica]|uniref:Dentin sialophospho protein n=1 Tax=Striga asiatica TaxID=4170 RepID=A0A5A7PFQ7_STRAF|nr:dentin sialophospho protein [Striga asiatica]